MLEAISPFFEKLYDETGWNFIIFYESYEYDRFIDAVWVSLKLIVACLIFSLIGTLISAVFVAQWIGGAPMRVRPLSPRHSAGPAE